MDSSKSFFQMSEWVSEHSVQPAVNDSENVTKTFVKTGEIIFHTAVRSRLE